MPEIASFVFFDIETTGLPWQEANQTKIIEFSFVATLRKDLEAAAYGRSPPVSKLTFVLNPQRPIHRDVVQMTGLSNDLLRHAPVFSQKVNSIVAFIEDLPAPVCLVAHNGNVFDFKILLAEFLDADASLPDDLYCVDSLVGFRNILKGTDLCYKNLNLEVQATSFPSSTTDDIMTDDDEENDWPDLNMSREEWKEIDDICVNLSDISCEDFSESENEAERQGKTKTAINRSNAIKNVFCKNKNKINNDVARECFKLGSLYKRLLNKDETNAHRAEVDCIMLLQCAVAVKHKFLCWADDNCKPLAYIQPLNRNYHGGRFRR